VPVAVKAAPVKAAPGDGLVGRDVECRRFDGLLEQLRQGRGGALVLSGEPGVGKTALLDYVVARAGDAMVVCTSGLESEASLSYAGLGDLMRPMLSRLGELPRPLSVPMSAALAVALPAQQPSSYAVSLATLRLLTASAENQPVLVVVDDAHWLDPPSATALTFAARRLRADPVAVVFATRVGEPTRFDIAGIDVVHVEGLDEGASWRLLESLRPGRISAAVAHELWRVTGGNPLALTEAGHRLDDDQLGGRVPLEDPLPVGQDLEADFGRRLDPLPAATRLALLMVALSASTEVQGLAAALASVGVEWSVLDPAHAAGLLRYESGHVVFTHPLMRSAVRELAAATAATGEQPHPHGDWPVLQRLTAQELHVALAVARGLSNPEIAEALFISRKTVEAHLSSAYRKLGLRSRTQLVRHLAQAGAVPM